MSTVASFNVLGTRVSALTLAQTVGLFAERIDRRERGWVAVCTVNDVVHSLQSPAVRESLNRAWLTTPDGMPLVWWGRRASSSAVSRVYGPDLLRAILTDARHRDTRHFFYGGGPGVMARLLAGTSALNPAARIAGTITPPFRALTAAEEDATAAEINAAHPDIVWVGLGCPKQNLWMVRFRPLLEAPIVVGVGAAFDFLAGVKRQAPRWMQRSGLEWLFRLVAEPRRLWRRYLVSNTVFVAHALAYATGLARYPLDLADGLPEGA
jgi:N-acetylglucosaminyldiphosphoundecaprenol N-acetyl-beta-D-mannosaminyltransferase